MHVCVPLGKLEKCNMSTVTMVSLYRTEAILTLPSDEVLYIAPPL